MLVCTFPGFSVRNSQVQIAIASFSWVTVSTGGIIQAKNDIFHSLGTPKFIMHGAISYYFTQILNMNRVETCKHKFIRLI